MKNVVFDEVRLTYLEGNAWKIRFRWCSEFTVRGEFHPRRGGEMLVIGHTKNDLQLEGM